MARRKRTVSDRGVEARINAIRMKHAPKALMLAHKIRTGLLKLMALEKTAMKEAQSEYAVFSVQYCQA
jgi:hypothetical protein